MATCVAKSLTAIIHKNSRSRSFHCNQSSMSLNFEAVGPDYHEILGGGGGGAKFSTCMPSVSI